MESIGKNIKRLRLERNWTQRELADLVGAGENYIGAIERGERPAGNKLIGKLAGAFGVDELTIRYGDRREVVDEDLRLLHEETEKVFEMVKARSNAAKHSFMAKMLKALEEESL